MRKLKVKKLSLFLQKLESRSKLVTYETVFGFLNYEIKPEYESPQGVGSVRVFNKGPHGAVNRYIAFMPREKNADNSQKTDLKKVESDVGARNLAQYQ